MCCIIIATDNSHSYLLFGLWSSRSWELYQVKGGCSWSSKQNISCLVSGVLLCISYKSLKDAVADPTWAQSTIVTIMVCDDFVCSGERGIHGYNQQQQQDMACGVMWLYNYSTKFEMVFQGPCCSLPPLNYNIQKQQNRQTNEAEHTIYWMETILYACRSNQLDDP